MHSDAQGPGNDFAVSGGPQGGPSAEGPQPPQSPQPPQGPPPAAPGGAPQSPQPPQPPPGPQSPPPGAAPQSPPPGQPGQFPQQQQPAWPAPAPLEPTNSQAVASLVLAVAGALIGFFSLGLGAPLSLVLGILAIFFGRKGRERVDSGELTKQRGIAQAGMIVGMVVVGLSVLAIGGWTVAFIFGS